MISCRCPYCGKEISYFTGLGIRRRGEYYCKKCKKESNIHINKTIWALFFSMIVISLVILGYYLFMTDKENLWFALFVAIPFLLFYLFSPLFIRLRPKKKFQDSLYDTEMVNTPIADPDPTMATAADVAPAFADEDDYVPVINTDIFNAIKEERRIEEDTSGGTKSFDRFENISSSADISSTRPVKDLKNIGNRSETGSDKYDLSMFN